MKLNINDEQGIEILHFIFEREFKPPFRKDNHCFYYNLNDKCVGYMITSSSDFYMDPDALTNIQYKVCTAYELNTFDWWVATKPHLKSWMENQLNVKLNTICQWF